MEEYLITIMQGKNTKGSWSTDDMIGTQKSTQYKFFFFFFNVKPIPPYSNIIHSCETFLRKNDSLKGGI